MRRRRHRRKFPSRCDTLGDVSQDYEYRGMIAAAWDLLRGDYSAWPDRAFYREIIERDGKPALDVGCGTGRLVLDYVAAGLDVDGVDVSPEMLALCRAKARDMGIEAAIHEQRMEALELPRRYRTIFVPSSSFQLLTSETDARAALARFFAHLLPGGLLVMPFMMLWRGEPPEDGAWSKWYVAGQRERPEDRALVRRWQRAKYDTAAQLEHTEDRYEVLAGDEIIETEEHRRSPAARWYTQAQAAALYADAGFVDVRVTEGFTHEPATADARVFTVFGHRPA